MSSYPNRCQHIKINGTQCGSPALRRNKFCFFHKKWHEQRIRINARQASRARSIDLPVLEDANSIQVALMQIMRMTMAGELDTKKAGLLLYALQTASFNLRHTNFEPFMHSVVLDPRNAADSLLGESQLWSDEDFEEEDDEEGDQQEDASDFADIEAVSSVHAPKKATRAELVVSGGRAGYAGAQVKITSESWSTSKASDSVHSEMGKDWSGRPGSNRRHPAWEAGVLPLNYSRPAEL